MARTGVTQEQVNAAADGLLVAGERPTIERVRAVLGTGSPNTLTRCLEIWWRQLGTRLSAHEAKLALPEAPEAVVVAASQLWLSALEHAQANAREALKGENAALAHARSELADQREQLQHQVKDAQAAAEAALAARALAEGRLADLERLVAQQAGQLKDLQAQRDHAISERNRLDEEVQGLRHQLAEAQARVQLEIAAWTARHQADQDRWLQEVDRARQEAKRAEDKLRSVEREAGEAVRRAQAAQQEAQRAFHHVECGEQAALARSKTLEEQVQSLQERLADLARSARVAPKAHAGSTTPRKKVRNRPGKS